MPTSTSKSSVKLSEADLLTLLRQGEYAGYQYLYDNYSDVLYNVIYRIVNSELVAEDVLQDVFVKIWTNIGQYDGDKGSLFTWMVNITRNKAIDTMRSRQHKNDMKTSPADLKQSEMKKIHEPHTAMEHFDIIGFVHRLIDQERFVIELAYFQGYSHSAIADEFDMPLGTVKSRIRSGIINLRRILSEVSLPSAMAMMAAA